MSDHSRQLYLQKTILSHRLQGLFYCFWSLSLHEFLFFLLATSTFILFLCSFICSRRSSSANFFINSSRILALAGGGSGPKRYPSYGTLRAQPLLHVHDASCPLWHAFERGRRSSSPVRLAIQPVLQSGCSRHSNQVVSSLSSSFLRILGRNPHNNMHIYNKLQQGTAARHVFVHTCSQLETTEDPHFIQTSSFSFKFLKMEFISQDL